MMNRDMMSAHYVGIRNGFSPKSLLGCFFTAGDLLIKPQRPRTSSAAIPTRPGARSARRITSSA